MISIVRAAVYDPIVGHPVEIGSYTEKVFGEKIDMKLFTDSVSQLETDIECWLD